MIGPSSMPETEGLGIEASSCAAGWFSGMGQVYEAAARGGGTRDPHGGRLVDRKKPRPRS
ncbi:hypothetical protein GCM10009823_07430 [Brevibacterium salitolerans]|uniref:Uncharacterized protein n=1 Tax=Brevibacterium salitolerans TaxID=1403566 RepID=A0ABN2WER8_9MICO